MRLTRHHALRPSPRSGPPPAAAARELEARSREDRDGSARTVLGSAGVRAADRAFRSARRILVLGSLPVDGDVVGSILGLSRYLAARYPGHQIDCALDGELRCAFRELDREGRIVRPSALPQDQEPYDLVVLLDGSAKNGLGAGAPLLNSARQVLVVDHHQGADLDGPPARMIKLIDPSRDATGEMVAELIERLGGLRDLDAAARASIALPLALGIHTDTRGLKRPGTQARTRARYEKLVRDHLAGDSSAVPRAIQGRRSPAAMALFSRTPHLTGPLVDPIGAPLLSAYLGAGLPAPAILWEQIVHESWAIVAVPRALLDVALAVARLELRDADINRDDLLGWVFDWYERSCFADLSVLLVEHEDGVRVSCRSTARGSAVSLAEALGGGGRAGVAGCRTPIAAPLLEVQDRARQWLFDTHRSLVESVLRNTAGKRSPAPTIRLNAVDAT